MTTYYIQVFPSQSGSQHHHLWAVRDRTAERIDVYPSYNTRHVAGDHENILDVLRQRHPGTAFHKLVLNPGQYFPYMARPTASDGKGPGYNPDKGDLSRDARAATTGQLHALNQQLEQICRVVHPKDSNLQAYGHEIRNVLILASTEVEVLWKRTLEANGQSGMRTKDYIKLLPAMKLDQYRLDFPYYPWLKPMSPFGGWDTSHPSRSLGWYAAYNAVKHDRESQFAQATLMHAFEALGACFVMLCAQYGWDFALRDDAALRAFLRLLDGPQWTPEDCYIIDGNPTPAHYPFPRG
jgi:hypothetical protein